MYALHALKGQKFIAQGIALGKISQKTKRPERAKALKYWAIYYAFALTGRLLITIIPRAMPWAMSFWAFSPFLNHMRKFSNIY